MDMPIHSLKGKINNRASRLSAKRVHLSILRYYHDNYYCSCEGEEVSDSFVKPDVLLQECDAMTIIISNVANSKSPWPPSHSQMKNSKQLLPSTSM